MKSIQKFKCLNFSSDLFGVLPRQFVWQSGMSSVRIQTARFLWFSLGYSHTCLYYKLSWF